jgi:hypothetical protein
VDDLEDVAELAGLLRCQPVEDGGAHRGDVAGGGAGEDRRAFVGEDGEVPALVAVSRAGTRRR